MHLDPSFASCRLPQYVKEEGNKEGGVKVVVACNCCFYECIKLGLGKFVVTSGAYYMSNADRRSRIRSQICPVRSTMTCKVTRLHCNDSSLVFLVQFYK